MNVRYVLALSLAVNVALGAVVAAAAVRRLRAHGPSRDYARARTEHFAELAARARPDGPDAVLIGDSLTDWAEWHELLGRPIANRGISGDRIADVEARLDSALAGAPRVVFLAIGVNDLRVGRSPEAVASDHARLVAAVRARRPAARLVVVSLLPVNDSLLASSGERLSQAVVDQANRRLAAGAAAGGGEWLDLGPGLARPDGQLEERLTVDGVHLNGRGYRIWADALAPYLPPH